MSVKGDRFKRKITKTVAGQYLLYLPQGYAKSKDRRWPLMLFLHGAGERGNNLKRLLVHGPIKEARRGMRLPFIVVAPQCPADQWWDIDMAAALVDHIIERYRVDTSRVYVTGLSMGGNGTWQLICSYPEKFAAAIPICGPLWRVMKGNSISRIPIWCFHGAMDDAVPVTDSVRAVKWARDCGAKVKLTIYPDAGHDSWTDTYRNPAVYKWLLSHRLKRSAATRG